MCLCEYLHVYLCTSVTTGAFRDRRGDVSFHELELQVVVSHYVGAENQTGHPQQEQGLFTTEPSLGASTVTFDHSICSQNYSSCSFHPYYTSAYEIKDRCKILIGRGVNLLLHFGH